MRANYARVYCQIRVRGPFPFECAPVSYGALVDNILRGANNMLMCRLICCTYTELIIMYTYIRNLCYVLEVLFDATRFAFLDLEFDNMSAIR